MNVFDKLRIFIFNYCLERTKSNRIIISISKKPSMDNFIKENETVIYKDDGAFYNPSQKINRDISIMIINTFIKNLQTKNQNITVFEAMSATGLRGIRYFNEINYDCSILMNDFSQNAVNAIKKNLSLNNLNYQDVEMKITKTIKTIQSQKNIFLMKNDCNLIMASNKSAFHIIDIDPYGHFTPFLPYVFNSIKHNGLICLTATDTSVLCSNRKKCKIKYDVLIDKVPFYSEMALRAALSTVSRIAGFYECGITPILSLSIGFYIRIFVKIEKKIKIAKETSEKCGYFLTCRCGYNIEILYQYKKEILNCPICSKNLSFCGPLWKDKLHDIEFINQLENKIQCKRIDAIISLVKQENTHFGYVHIPSICSALSVECIPMKILISSIFQLNKDVSFTHCKENSIKTNCTFEKLCEIIKNYFTNRNFIPECAKAIDFCNQKFNRELINKNGGPLSKPKK